MEMPEMCHLALHFLMLQFMRLFLRTVAMGERRVYFSSNVNSQETAVYWRQTDRQY